MTSNGDSSGRQAMQASDVCFFWVEDGDPHEARSYHWSVDCAWVAVAVWHGGRLVASEAPPPGAADAAWVRRTLEENLGGPAWQPDVVDSPADESRHKRWLCTVCGLYSPRPVAVPRPTDTDPCAKCGCSREIHLRCRSRFDGGCGMAWADADYDRGGELMGVRLCHCPCDGYEPPAGGRPVTASDFLTEHDLDADRNPTATVTESLALPTHEGEVTPDVFGVKAARFATAEDSLL